MVDLRKSMKYYIKELSGNLKERIYSITDSAFEKTFNKETLSKIFVKALNKVLNEMSIQILN